MYMNMNKIELKLKIELVPSTSWYDNLRKKTSKTEWDKIRKQSYADANHKCAICGADGRLNCHEIWEYDDKTHIQKLTGFIALCNNCHMIKHIGFAGIQASKGLLDMEKLIEHFMKVNNCNREVFEKHLEEAFAQWRERSKHEWQVDLGAYTDVIERRR